MLGLRGAASRLLGARRLCGAADAGQAELLDFLRNASRPIWGRAKAKQSGGQAALDLTKQLPRLEGLDLRGLLACKTAELKERGVPVRERKRMLNFIDKYRQGWRHDGRGGPGNEQGVKRLWKGWRPPYQFQQGRPGAPASEVQLSYFGAALAGRGQGDEPR